MKENLMLKKYITEPANGTFNLLEKTTFFGSKMIDIEDSIIINDAAIDYFQYSNNLESNDGYQYYVLNNFLETFFLLDLVQIKYDNHTISKGQQIEQSNLFNTKWIITLDIKTILREYLFAKIKNERTFKSLKYYNFLNNNINESIRQYINLNILDRYQFEKIDFYIKYIDIKNNSLYNGSTLKQFDPQYDSSIELASNKVSNIEISNINLLNTININYSQTKPSDNYKFDYYFNIYYTKI